MRKKFSTRGMPTGSTAFCASVRGSCRESSTALMWDSYNPATDPNVYQHYSVDDMSGKAKNKRRLQERLYLEQDPDVPMIGMVTRMVSHKGLDLVKEQRTT